MHLLNAFLDAFGNAFILIGLPVGIGGLIYKFIIK